MSFPEERSLRFGYTTGSCAAAASKAALLFLLYGWRDSEVEVLNPEGERLRIPIAYLSAKDNTYTAGVVKDAGDDFDVTHGLTVYASVQLTAEDSKIEIVGGKGVGTVTSPGLAVKVGEPAINPVPRKMITDAVKDFLPSCKGMTITIEVPEGDRVASKTFNPRLGIVGGISILGTTGIVRPMSQDAFLESLIPQIDQAVSLGYKELVLTPGGKGVKMAADAGIDKKQVVQMSNFVGPILDACLERKIKSVLLFGHLGKLIKVASGIFRTQSRDADARRETLAAYLAMTGASKEIINSVMEFNTIEESVSFLKERKMENVYHSLAKAASCRCIERTEGKIEIGTAMYTLAGEIIGWDNGAVSIGGRLSWLIHLK